MALVIIALCGVAVFLPIILGIRLFLRTDDPYFSRFAGLLTLKPLLATPIWMMIGSATATAPRAPIVLTLLPGIGLTVLLLIAYKDVLRDETTRQSAIVLLVLDCVRWINSFIMLLSASTPASGLLIFVAIALPGVFALVASWIAGNLSEKLKNKPKNDEKPKREVVEI